jgi:hypothetical protein
MAVSRPDDMSDEIAREDEALELRTEGKSFAAIAKRLHYERAPQAIGAFNRALRRKPTHEKAALRSGELARLDAMAERIRAKKRLKPEEVVSQLRVVERLRDMLLAD